jgi:hypothetical protein
VKAERRALTPAGTSPNRLTGVPFVSREVSRGRSIAVTRVIGPKCVRSVCLCAEDAEGGGLEAGGETGQRPWDTPHSMFLHSFLPSQSLECVTCQKHKVCLFPGR